MPPRRERFIFLIYLVFLFMQPGLGGGQLLDWLLAIAMAVAFTAWYLSIDRLEPWMPWLLVALAFIACFWNSGATVFFVYAAFMFSNIYFHGRLWRRLGLLAGIMLVQAALLYWMHGSFYAVFSHGISLGMIGFAGVLSIGEFERKEANRRLRQANEHIATVSKVAERERIARDMHDVLGHTLSVVVLKSELAGKLLAANPERAASEIADVERLARSALKEVRSAIAGYRERGFEGELANARLAFEAADMTFSERVSAVPFTPDNEPVVALVLREAVTNVLRHSRASYCSVELDVLDGEIVLTVSDDGVGGDISRGAGLKGMEERLMAIGGRLELDAADGMRLRAVVPA